MTEILNVTEDSSIGRIITYKGEPPTILPGATGFAAWLLSQTDYEYDPAELVLNWLKGDEND